MGLWERFKTNAKVKAHAEVAAREDIGETLDYSYQRQLDMLAKVKRGVVDVATSRKQVDTQINEIDSQITGLTTQAEKAISLDREDLAREALSRKAILVQQKADLTIQRNTLSDEEEKLTKSCAMLQAKVESFRIKKETLKATYTAAAAQTKINESFAGLGGEFADVGMALTRAEDKTLEMQARSDAIGELISSGALDDGGGTDFIDVELNSISMDNSIENELAALKSGRVLELGAGNNG